MKQIEPEREFPLLTDKNAMEFFLEYEKVNVENKVRIKTDFGDIDILLFDKTKFHRANFIFLTKQNYFQGTQFSNITKDKTLIIIAHKLTALNKCDKIYKLKNRSLENYEI